MKIKNLFLVNSGVNTTEILSALLSSEMALYIKTRKSQWNDAMETYGKLHRIFKNQYEQLDRSMDEILDRIAKEAQNSRSTVIEFSTRAPVPESEGKYDSSEEMLKDLFKDHEAIIFQLRSAIKNCIEQTNDTDTAGFLENLAEQHERTAWTLRRSLILISIDQKCQSV